MMHLRATLVVQLLLRKATASLVFSSRFFLKNDFQIWDSGCSSPCITFDRSFFETISCTS
ncbi:hypothetical protein M758_10G160800 [Ceratodon purpureus]|nr:hypothetical protein M758_10G160800 [Ceratodon purpureus]